MTNIEQETPHETIERCAKHGASWLGDKVEFRFQGVDTPRSQAKAIFGRHGFGDYVVADPRVQTVLKDSAKRGSNPDGYMVREFASANRDTPIAIHVTRISGSGEGGDEYTCLARVRIGYRQDPITGEKVPFALARPPEGQTEFADSTARDRALWIANACNHRLSHVLTADVAAATRNALESLGGVKSLGGGNNYWLASGIAERAHAFLEELTHELGAYYLRSPITTLGAPSTAAAMGTAAQSSLESDLQDMEATLEKFARDLAAPNARKKTATLKHQIATLEGLAAKTKLYEAVVAQKVTERLGAIRTKLQGQFQVLLDGGSVLVQDAPPSSDVEPAPATDRSPNGEAMAAAAGDDASDPYAW